ncbi:lysophospholipid acyltransferase family protein [uncultured Aquabacterium sp.]|uniref:lysophospholipid acyltransferase family protein n=1 Tax=uncultured Aquabacterium sp. TaxID=158753 RepID=UPI0030CF1236
MSAAAPGPVPTASMATNWWRAPIAIWRLSRVMAHILYGLVLVYTVWDAQDAATRERRTIAWSMRLLNLLGLTVQCQGQPHAGSRLVISNHISWLDIIVINSVMPSRFVSKAEVGQWPVIGRLVTAAGTLFLVRERRRDAMRVLGLMAQALRDGQSVAVFPEGTTGAGRELMHFHANLVQSAIDAPAPIQPVVLSYRDAQHAVSPSAAYIGDTGLLTSMWMVASAKDLTVSVQILPAETVTHADRRMLTERLHSEMSQRLSAAIRAASQAAQV